MPLVTHPDKCKQADESLPRLDDASSRVSVINVTTSLDRSLPSDVKEEQKCWGTCLLKIKHEKLNILSSHPRKM